jgi:serine/threonine protein kinase
VFSQEIVASRPLPITYSVSDRLGSGKTASGKVYKAKLFTHEHDFQLKSTNIALKVIPKEDDAKRETKVLTHLVQNGQARLHPHIARFYGGFQFNGATYLMAELADTDLEHFMERTPTPLFTAYFDAVWLKRQFRGLAQALHAVHTKHPTSSPQTYSSTRVPTLTITRSKLQTGAARPQSYYPRCQPQEAQRTADLPAHRTCRPSADLMETSSSRLRVRTMSGR